MKTIHGSEYNTKIVKRIFKQIQSKTIVDVLKNGIKDNGIKLVIAYDKPNSTLNADIVKLYSKNIFSVMRQVVFTDVATNTIQDCFMGDGFKIFQQFRNNDNFKKVFLAQLFEKVSYDMGARK